MRRSDNHPRNSVLDGRRQARVIFCYVLFALSDGDGDDNSNDIVWYYTQSPPRTMPESWKAAERFDTHRTRHSRACTHTHTPHAQRDGEEEQSHGRARIGTVYDEMLLVRH